jgi:predicted double-glycine peptidase
MGSAMRKMPVLLLSLLLVGCGTSSSFWDRGNPNVVQRHTLKELRDLHVVKQARDYSCAAAALATLLTYYFGDGSSEQQILDLLEGPLSEEEKQKKLLRGFSLLDLKQVAQLKGYRAAGFKLTINQLAQLVAPVIVFVEPLGYKHFAVYRGIDRGRVYLADPVRGNLRMSIGRFLEEWGGIVFVLSRPGEEAILHYPLELPRPEYVQPEIARFNGQLDLGMLFRTLPLR